MTRFAFAPKRPFETLSGQFDFERGPVRVGSKARVRKWTFFRRYKNPLDDELAFSSTQKKPVLDVLVRTRTLDGGLPKFPREIRSTTVMDTHRRCMTRKRTLQYVIAYIARHPNIFLYGGGSPPLLAKIPKIPKCERGGGGPPELDGLFELQIDYESGLE